MDEAGIQRCLLVGLAYTGLTDEVNKKRKDQRKQKPVGTRVDGHNFVESDSLGVLVAVPIHESEPPTITLCPLASQVRTLHSLPHWAKDDLLLAYVSRRYYQFEGKRTGLEQAGVETDLATLGSEAL